MHTKKTSIMPCTICKSNDHSDECNNKVVVLAVVGRNGDALWFASEDLKVGQDGDALWNALEDLTADILVGGAGSRWPER